MKQVSTPRFSRMQIGFITLCTLLGTLLRLSYIHDLPFVGDEVGTLTLIGRDCSYLLSHFSNWLTMNYFLAAEKWVASILGANGFGLRIISLVSGAALIPLTAILARFCFSRRVAVISAALVAGNPFLVKYSGIARSYALFCFLSIVVTLSFLTWEKNRTKANAWVAAVSSYLCVLSHPYGVYPVLSMAVMIAIRFIRDRSDHGARFGTESLFFPALCFAAAVVVSYYRLLPEMLKEGRNWHVPPPSDISWMPLMFAFHTSGGWGGLLSFMFVALAVVCLIREGGVKWGLLLLWFVPILAVSLQGLTHFPWGYARFFIFMAPVTIILIAQGIELFARYFGTSSRMLPRFLAAAVLFAWMPEVIVLFQEKNDYPWNRAAELIRREAGGKKAIVVGIDGAAPLHLNPLLSEASLRVVTLGELQRERRLDSVDRGGKVLLVSHLPYRSRLDHWRFPEPELVTSRPVSRLGRIRIVDYSSDGRNSSLDMMEKDFLATIRHDIPAPGFAPYHSSLAALSGWRGDHARQLLFERRYRDCMELTERYRYMPLPVRLHYLKNEFGDSTVRGQ